jgi:excinuclease ABC subunit A
VVIVLHQSPDAKSPDRKASDAWQERVLNTRYACPRCQTGIGEIEPRTFSFNSPYGACPACGGLGVLAQDEDKETGRQGDKEKKEEKVGPRSISLSPPLPVSQSSSVCPACKGTRLRPEARASRLGGLAIYEIAALATSSSLKFFHELRLDEDRATVAAPLVSEITRRLEFLARVGVDYLSLDRSADTLSGGERQRVRLATGIGSGLVGVLYLLDEPSIGLHPRDNGRLIAALRDLQQQGNSVVVVEHDEEMMRAGDYLIDIGPGAGPRGGRIVAQGSLDEVARDAASIAGAYLSGRKRIEGPPRRRLRNSEFGLRIEGACANNLLNIDVEIPLGLFVGVTGVSGSGKSSLILDSLAPAIAREVNKVPLAVGEGLAEGESAQRGYRTLRGAHHLARLVQVDSSPIGRTPRSSAATYTGIWNDIRRVFAGTKQSRQRGYRTSRFSFNAKGGRCEECKGAGVRRIAMNFLPDLEVTCPVCHGQRFNRQTLAARFREKSIADVLAMSVNEAATFFVNHASIHRVLTTLADVGLGYLTIGQPATTLSGGEAQRIKLAAELARPAAGHTLYILDEPTTGLSTDDIGRLLGVLHRLVDQGNSMIVIEHNLDVIRTADWVIDLGPEGGAGGGRVVVAGTPEDVAACEASHTGRFLRAVIDQRELTQRR